MNTKQLLAALAILSASTSVLAQTSEYVTPNEKFVSTKTRAEVIAELKQAQADGTYIVAGEEYPNQFPALAKKMRDRGESIESAQSRKAAPSANGS